MTTTKPGGGPPTEDRLRALHRSTRELVRAENRSDVAELAVEAANEVLGFPFSILWRPTADGGLEAVAVSAELERYLDADDPSEEMRFGPDGWLRSLYEADTAQRIEVSEEMSTLNAPYHTGITVPLDGALLTTGTESDRDLSEAEVQLATVLGKNVEVALQRTEREQTLRRQSEGLTLLNRMLRHDVRNNLQTILGRIERVRSATGGEASEHVDALEGIVDDTVSTIETAGRMADAFSRAESSRQPIALKPLLEREIDQIGRQNPGAEIVVDGEIPDATVLANDMLDSVLRNVVTNAIEHNDADTPSVTVSVASGDEAVTVRVADNGPGIPAEARETVFERGWSGEDSGGTGLGLHLVATLVEQYGGEVRLADDGSEGATFDIELPLESATSA